MEGCKQEEVIRRPSAADKNWPVILNVQFSGKSLTTSLDYTEVSIRKTGMYNLFFVACDPKLKEMVMSGKTIWKNPDGYLPGRMAPLKKFYVFMTLAYLCLSILWFLQYVRFWNDILQLQHCVAAVIALGLFEMMLWYFEYVNFNNTGMRPVVLTTWVVSCHHWGYKKNYFTTPYSLCIYGLWCCETHSWWSYLKSAFTWSNLLSSI